MSVMPLHFTFPGIPNVHCLFPLRSFDEVSSVYGTSNLSYEVGDDPNNVSNTRNLLCQEFHALGLDYILDAHQVHGETLLFAPEKKTMPFDADGLATDTPHTGLLIKTADCQSILCTERMGRFIMALHVGWRGNRSCFIQKSVALFCEHFGISPKDIFAVRGPSLGPQKAEFVNFEKEWGCDFQQFFDRQSKTMNLWALSRMQLEEAGLLSQNIFGIDICTMSNSSCFSYRRDRICGRLGGIIWLQ